MLEASESVLVAMVTLKVGYSNPTSSRLRLHVSSDNGSLAQRLWLTNDQFIAQHVIDLRGDRCNKSITNVGLPLNLVEALCLPLRTAV